MFGITKKDFQEFVFDKKINYYLRRIITLAIPFKKYRRSWRFKLLLKYYNYEVKKIAKEKYADSYIFFSRNGVGDVFFAASLIKEFKKTHHSKVVYLTEKKSIAKFLKSFKSIDEVVYNDDFSRFQSLPVVQRKIEKEQINFLYFPYRGSKPNYVFCDSYANLLDVSLNSERELPEISNEDVEKANAEIERLEINPEKTIILIPENVMWDYRVIRPKVWKSLAQRLQSLGYDVVFNSKNKEYKKFKSTFIPINAFVHFASQAKYIISFRSGIDDLLVGMGITNLTAIYPNNMEVIWTDKFVFDNLLNKYHIKTKESELDNLMHIYSLSSNFNKKIDEIIYNGFEDELIEKLIERLM